jgi:hypothetical protein
VLPGCQERRDRGKGAAEEQSLDPSPHLICLSRPALLDKRQRGGPRVSASNSRLPVYAEDASGDSRGSRDNSEVQNCLTKRKRKSMNAQEQQWAQV